MSEKTRDEIEALKVKSLQKRKPDLICPILSLSQGEFVPASCQGERCAWFVTWNGSNDCALKVLANRATAL